MTAEEAQARLSRMVDANTAPVIDADELAELLELSAVADSDGLAPSDANWTPTYELARGAKEGWTRKAGRVAGLVDYSDAGFSVHRSQQRDACLEMAKAYGRKIAGSVAAPGQLARADE
jgi:hypothetical protein